LEGSIGRKRWKEELEGRVGRKEGSELKSKVGRKGCERKYITTLNMLTYHYNAPLLRGILDE
jgi:hypothetical protein